MNPAQPYKIKSLVYKMTMAKLCLWFWNFDSTISYGVIAYAGLTANSQVTGT